jgi:FMN phosphatase YigB (HAD superfamily)/DNA-binding XRE family transcriptional regulator
MNEGAGLEIALGKHLQSARQKAGLTQQQLCQKAGLSYSTLAKIERGAIKAPSVFTIGLIADAVNMSLDDLMGRKSSLSTGQNKKTSKSGVKFVYFDINGCLVRFFHRAFTSLAEDTGVGSDIVETAFWHYNDAVCRGDMSMKQFNQFLAQTLKVESVDWMGYYLKEIDPITEMHSLLNWANEHYHIGLISNIMPGFIEAMLGQGLIPNIPYSAIIDSSEVGSIKPEEQIYEIATKKSGVQPDQILLVDDSRSNVMAAEKKGWKVIWFDDYRSEDSAVRVKKALDFDDN